MGILFFLRNIMAGFMYGLSANAPIILSAVPLVAVPVVLLACYLPHSRATKVDPLVALHYEEHQQWLLRLFGRCLVCVRDLSSESGDSGDRIWAKSILGHIPPRRSRIEGVFDAAFVNHK
jgi:hypothetical protein